MGMAPKAVAAADRKWDFNNAADYTTDDNLAIFDYDGTGDGVLHFQATWDSTGLGGGLAGNAINDMLLDSSGRMWAIVDTSSLYYSDDNGATWTLNAAFAALGVAVAYDVIEPVDGPTVGVKDIYVICNKAGVAYAAYSLNNGAAWVPVGIVGGPFNPVSAISWDSVTNEGLAVSASGQTLTTTGDGKFLTATAGQPIDLTGGLGILYLPVGLGLGDDYLIVAGTNAGGGRLEYSVDLGASWTAGSLPGSPSSVWALSYNEGWVYAGGTKAGASSHLININLAGGGDMNDAGDWVERTNLGVGDPQIVFGFIDRYPTTPPVFMAAVKAAGGTAIISTIDDGAHWLVQYSIMFAAVPIGDLLWNAGTGQLVWGGSSGASDVWAGTLSVAAPTATSVVTADSINIDALTSVAGNAHTDNTGTLSIAWGTEGTDAGTWYYYNAGWQSSAADDATKANSIADLIANPGWFATFPLSGTIHLKFYSQGALIWDDVTVIYLPPEGSGPSADQTAPTSQVDALPRYSTVPNLCDPELTITATADDTGGSGVKQVSLYISSNGSDFALWEDVSNPDHSKPYRWIMPVDHNQTDYFYSIAEDNAGNIEGPPTNPGWDTFTTLDLLSPYLLGSTTPADGSRDVPLSQPVVLNFSEPMLPESLTFEFTLADPPDSPVDDTSVQWSNQDQTATITHGPLEYSTRYRFYITSATDRVGNQIVEFPLHCPGGSGLEIAYPPLQFFFTTVARQDPDLRDSTLTVADGPNADKTYNPNDNAEYTLRLVNTSIYGADNATATINFAAGISFVEAKDTRFRTIEQSGKVIGLIWSGSVPGSGSGANIVTAKYVMRVDSPANRLSIAQTVTIDDGVNPPFVPQPPAMLYIARHPQFDTSSKTVDSGRAMPGELLTYAIAIRNTGTTVVDVELADYVPAESSTDRQPPTFFKPGSIIYDTNESRWVTPPYYDAATQTIRAVASGALSGSASLTLGFQAVVRGDITEETDFVNTAYVWDPNIDPPQRTALTASTHVPGPKPPLRITLQSPTPNTRNNALKQSIKVGFNSSVDLAKPFEYSLLEAGRRITGEELATWMPSWDTFNSIPNALFTLTPPGGELAVGADYTISITAATNTDGKVLERAPVTWGFTTADPTVRITTPPESLYELLVNTLSDPFTVTLIDGITGQQYKAEEDITIGLRAYLGAALRGSGSFWTSGQHPLGATPKITISKGNSSAIFYYKDSEVSTPNYVTIRVFEDPYRGWADDEKYVEVVDSEQPTESLTLDTPSSITVGRLSAPITVGATNAKGATRFLPQGRLYLYTDSASGAFYDNNRRKLPLLDSTGEVTIQGVAPQYVEIGPNIITLTLYYLSDQAGAEKVTVSDNNPQLPDIGLNDAGAILKIEAIKEEELLKELEDVIDDSGRVIERMTINPNDVTLLPKGNQTFKVVGYDTDNKPIDNLKFKWFVLVIGSGVIERDGHGGNSHTSVFTAGSTLGNYYDTVLAATLYNGKLAYATATVRITDVVNYKGPRKLPTTGMNGLQLILLGLTLVAAVALAWVEHYDKTHFKQQRNG